MQTRQPPAHLARLNTAHNLAGPGAMFSPMLQTPLQFNNPFPNIPQAPQRPGHRANQASVQLAAAGIIPPTPGIPVATPSLGHFPRPSMLGGGTFNFGEQPSAPNWQQKRRNKQLSIGGPPKAVLGGPQRKMSVSPLPKEDEKEKTKFEEEKVKLRKKTTIKLPRETLDTEKGERQPWARYPMALPMEQEPIRQLEHSEITTHPAYPPDLWRDTSTDVFLPPKLGWQKLKNRAIEEKLDRLGVTAGSGTTTTTNGGPTVWAPHARAASISSPADPALLLSKLRKLQSQQEGSTDAGSSLASSPVPPSLLSFGHAHSQSLASNPFGPHATLGSDGPNFIHAPHARAPLQVPSLSTDRLTPPGPAHRMAPPMSAVGGTIASAHPASKPDFIRGFGLDLEEVEEVDENGHSRQNSANLLETEKWVKAHSRQHSMQDNDPTLEIDEPEDRLPSWAMEGNRINSTQDDGLLSPAPDKPPKSPYLQPADARSRSQSDAGSTSTNELTPLASALTHPPNRTSISPSGHSRHVSKLSAALSLRSVGGVSAELEETRKAIVSRRQSSDISGEVDMSLDVDERMDEWTGTDDEDELSSLGEYSNPSDEEKARQDRLERRRLRALAKRSLPHDSEETPRHLPNFPQPPDNTLNFSLPFDRSQRHILDDEDWRSNPSEEGAPTRDFLGVTLGGTGGLAMSEFNFHSRQNSANSHLTQRSTHDPANAHSRVNSHTSDVPMNHQPRPSFAAPMPALNPFAQPFKFGGATAKDLETPAWFKTSFAPPQVSVRPPDAELSGSSTPGAPPNAPFIGGHTRLPSFGKPLSVAAPEFKPSFLVSPPTTVPSSNAQAPSSTNRMTFNPAAQEFKPSGKTPLFNVHAAEFKPSFTFRPPASAPSMPIAVTMPHPEPLEEPESHREKRVRRSEIDEDEPEPELEEPQLKGGHDSMSSFKFPHPSSTGLSPLKVRNIASDESPETSLKDGDDTNEPFSYSKFEKNSLSGMPEIPKTPTEVEHSPQDRRTSLTMAIALGQSRLSDSGSEPDESTDQPPSFPVAQPSGSAEANTAPAAIPFKQRRAPIPLDFKHPVSNTTVPAGLFKSLVNGSNANPAMGRASPKGEDRTRRTVRSRLSSRDVFDMEHRSDASLDDLHVAGISLSHKASRARMTVDSGAAGRNDEDIFNGAVHGHVKRRSSLPDGLGAGTHRPVVTQDDNASVQTDSGSEFVGESVPNTLAARLAVQQMERRLDQMEDFEARLEDLLEDKMAKIYAKASLDPATEERITEVLSLFRTHLQESAAKSMEGVDVSRAEAAFDFEMMRDVVREGQEEVRSTLQAQFDDLLQQLADARVSSKALGESNDIGPLMEQLTSHTLHTVQEVISNKFDQLQAMTHHAAQHTQEIILENMSAALTPILQYARADPVDYDLLTNKLSNAVRPTLADVLDLASDKRETAELIVKQIVPLLPKPTPSPSPLPPDMHPGIDQEALAQRLSREVRQAIGPIDPFEMKEQVSDLVVERLNAVLSVRDKGLSPDVLATKVVGNIADLLEPIWGQFATLKSTHEDLAFQQSEFATGQTQLLNILNSMPSQIDNALEEIKAAAPRTPLLPITPPAPVFANDPALDSNVSQIKNAVENILGGQKSLSGTTESLVAMYTTILEKLNTLPDSLNHSTSLLHNAQADLDHARETHKREIEDLRRSSTQYQIDLAKARGAHGQVRVEKDSLADKLKIVEADREVLRTKLKELEAASSTGSEDVTSLEARNKELQDALAQALSRLQVSDAATQSNSERISELEKSNRDLMTEKSNLKAKIDSIDLQMTFAVRDKENALQSLATLQKQHEQLLSQQSHWDTLLETKQQVSMLTELMTQAEKNDIEELKRFKEQALVAQNEHVALQKRYKEQEAKIANSEKIAFTARQSLAAANQRASDWEKRSREYESKHEIVQTKLEQAEQIHAQLEADYSVAKLQLEERTAAHKFIEEQEQRMKDQINSLEEKARTLQAALSHAQAGRVSSAHRNLNGNAQVPVRPNSRASTVYVDSRSVTPTGTPPREPSGSVWDSMHAPGGVRDSGYSSMSLRSKNIAAPSPLPSRYPELGIGSRSRRSVASSVYSYKPPVSPTPSTATVDDQGWWS